MVAGLVAAMSQADDIKWFKEQFGDAIRAAIVGMPFTLDLIVAIAMQETGYLWGKTRKTKPVDEVLYLCVGDTLDAPRRSAFPKSRAALERVSRGKDMFAVARRALEAIAKEDKDYKAVARNPNKFCHGFSIFQYDIQSFRTDPEFFLQEQWRDFDKCLAKCLAELREKLNGKWARSLRDSLTHNSRTELSHDNLVYLAIAYNKGSARVGAGFKQGFKSSDGKYYGEMIDQYMRLAETVA